MGHSSEFVGHGSEFVGHGSEFVGHGSEFVGHGSEFVGHGSKLSFLTDILSAIFPQPDLFNFGFVKMKPTVP